MKSFRLIEPMDYFRLEFVIEKQAPFSYAPFSPGQPLTFVCLTG